MHPLFQAVQKGDEDAVREYLRKKPDAIWWMNASGLTPREYANNIGNVHMTALLQGYEDMWVDAGFREFVRKEFGEKAAKDECG